MTERPTPQRADRPLDRPTLRSVATSAGVSPQTVSNALNNPQLLLPVTLDRVLDAVARARYRPRRAARALRTSRSPSSGSGCGRRATASVESSSTGSCTP